MVNAKDFMGLSKHKAQDLAEKKYIIFRLVSVDGETFLGYPEDTRTDRVCVVIEKGSIVQASVQ